MEKHISNFQNTLVMVDDNQILLETNVQLLRIQGINVKGFYDCLEAIAFITKSTTVGCVMVDMKMPQMSGLEFVGHIINYIDCEKIILYSGNFEERDIELADKQGIRKLLRKPLTSAQIIEAVESCIH